MHPPAFRPLPVLAVLGLATAACNHTPVANLEKSFTLKVEAGTGDDSRVKIDFLWVVDNSSSMCQEQSALSSNFDKFVDSLEKNFDVDARIAVTSVDAQCQNNGSTVFAARGKFNQKVIRTSPIACAESEKFACTNDNECSDCGVLGECDTDGEWKCSRPALDICLVNPNGTLNTSCQRRCATDQECKDLFGDSRYVCLKPAGNTGCVLPPPNDDCPDEMPPFLEKNDTVDNTNLFKCIAHVGVFQETCLKYEQPMRAAFMALDPTGPNREQALAFLRDDAYLVVIIVSDEEDCSVAEGRDGMIVETDAFRCGLFPTTDTGGPLVPVAHFINRFKALKEDPGRVIMATIAGDSTASTEGARQAAREAYLESKSNPRDCYTGTYICDSDVGTADYGGRFIELADGFGPNGSFQNICSSGGLDAALIDIAETIVSVINRICLPKPILGALTVSRTRQGVTTTLTEGQGNGTYSIAYGAEECAVDGVIMPSLTFGDSPQPGDEINVVYQGDPQLP